MPATYEIDKQRRLVMTTAWGVCTAEDLLNFRKDIVSDSSFDPSFSELVDLTRATKMEFTPDEVRMLASSTPFSPGSRRAVVAPDQQIFGVSKMFSILRSLRGDHNLQVFHNLNEAMAWLEEREKAA